MCSGASDQGVEYSACSTDAFNAQPHGWIEGLGPGRLGEVEEPGEYLLDNCDDADQGGPDHDWPHDNTDRDSSSASAEMLWMLLCTAHGSPSSTFVILFSICRVRIFVKQDE